MDPNNLLVGLQHVLLEIVDFVLTIFAAIIYFIYNEG